jgi:hypothetical protein
VISGPDPEGGSAPSPEPELPGEFVSEDMRADCVRFLDELRALVRFRSEMPAESTAWVPDDPVD